MFRVGYGYDVHKFGGKGPITLGGEKIDYPQGVIAHSDGDVLIHALCDAILGASGLGDIGELYPDTDDAFLNIDSRILLRDTFKRITKEGYKISNVDITVMAQAPKLLPHKEKMRSNLAQDLNLPLNAVNIKATTTEGLGFVGRKEGIAASATALIYDDK